MAVQWADLKTKIEGYLPSEKLSLTEEAYRFAASKHQGQMRVSGGPYIEHPLETCLILADLHLDAATLVAALLHDVVEDCGVSNDEIAHVFGAEVARLVDGVTKLSRIDLRAMGEGKRSADEGLAQAESLRKMLVAMAQDIRVVLIKLADRLHNMSTLRALPQERRLAIARETMDIYVPLAHRLGIWDLKWRLEDLAFRHLDPEAYRQVSELIAARREEREAYIAQVCNILKPELEKNGVKAEVYGRPKNIYSIYEKTQKYASQGKEFGQIYDLYALRVLVNTQADCYHALGVVHALWSPIPGQFDDYIANPKDNLYRSLHTTVMCEGGVPLEVQIRTYEMHQLAEYGVAAHWRYKEGGARDVRFEEKMTWLRQLLEWQREVTGAEEFLESVKTDIFRDQVFAYTPKGEIKELPAGATPIDFAYLIHTDLGHRCIGAKVNGRLVSLDTQLQNGDTVEILTSKQARGPSLDWLNPELGYVKTASAREKVRQWFRRQERGASILRGRELLQRELKRLGMKMEDAEVVKAFRHDSMEEFLAALGSGSITAAQIATRLTPQVEPGPAIRTTAAPLTSPASGVQVLGVGDLLSQTARCCNPLPGDEIIGFITRSRGVTIHRKDCPNVLNEDEKERLVQVSWGPAQQLYPVRVRIDAQDRVGLLRDVSTAVSAENVNIASALTVENGDGTATITLTLHITGVGQLARLFSKLEAVRGALSVSRVSDGGMSNPAPASH